MTVKTVVNFQFQTELQKKMCHTWHSPPGKLNIFYFISPWGEKHCGIFYKNVLWTKHVSYVVIGLYKNYDDRFRPQEK